MQLPPIKRIQREDLADAPSWIDKLLYPLNLFMETVYNALNKNLTFGENIRSQDYDFKITTSTTYPAASSWTTTPISFKNSMGVKAKGLIIQNISLVSGTYTPITNAVSVQWTEANGQITIQYISGLAASQTYSVSLFIK